MVPLVFILRRWRTKEVNHISASYA